MPEAVAAAAPAAPVQPPPEVSDADALVDAKPEAPKADAAPLAEKAPEPKRTRKIKVNGADEEVDEESLILAGTRAKQIEQAARRQWEEAQAVKRELDGFRNTWEQDPVAALEKLGPAARQAAEQFLLRELQREQVKAQDPEKFELMRQAEEAKRLRAQVEEAQRQQQEQQVKAQQEHFAGVIDQEFAAVMKEANLPKTTESVRLLAQEAMRLADLGVPPTRDQLQAIVPIVREKIGKMAQSTLSGMEGEALLKFIGPDVRRRIRDAELALLKNSKKVSAPPPGPAARPENPRRPLTQEEWRAKYMSDLD